VPASWVGSPADFVDTDRIPKVGAVHIHEGEYMDMFAWARLEMAGVVISRMVLDSYCDGMVTVGSVAVDFLWTRGVVGCSLVGRSGA